MKPKAEIMEIETQIRKALEWIQETNEKIQRQEEELQKKNPYKLVKMTSITFVKYDKERFHNTLKKLGDRNMDQYVWVVNHVLIGSLGDPETWEGTPVNVAVKKGD